MTVSPQRWQLPDFIQDCLPPEAARLEALGAKKIASALTHSEIQNREAVALNLRTMICQAGVLVDECSRRLGGLPLYDSPDGWTIPFEILDTP